ncbi:divergent polysaccharide deacetylase family protein [Azospirillum sp. sgz302134]
MASKTPRKPRKAAAKTPSINPILLALAAVATVFAVGLGARFLIGRDASETVQTVAQRPEPPPPPPSKAQPTPPPVAEPPQVVTEPEPGQPADEPETETATAPPTPTPLPPPKVPEPSQKPEVAMLPPPIAPLIAPVQPPAGTPLWKKNSVPARVPPDRPAIAIVIDDMGVDRKRSTRAASLPAPLTLAWLPYAHDLSAQARAARASGHELLLHIPMEPGGTADPGPDALLVKLDRGEILRRAKAALDSFDGYVGVNNHMGSRFTSDPNAMAPVLTEIAKRGLLWLDSRTTPKSAGLTIAQQLKMPFAGRDVFLDNEMTVQAVRAQLAKTEQVAKHQGFAIAIGHPHDATIEALASWLPEVQKRGFVLVPVSAVVRAQHAGG